MFSFISPKQISITIIDNSLVISDVLICVNVLDDKLFSVNQTPIVALNVFLSSVDIRCLTGTTLSPVI